ncbi:DUF6771 family protein [uncultured Sphingomonas sp.]|uniref:DUF6771 family protein n=1 Tax=uncultured Sphingomonas sp. TaxID=158754 RepID=UPI0035CC0341
MNTTMTNLPNQLLDAIADAPKFAVIGLSMRDAAMRERAALVLANHLADRLEHPLPAYDMDQLNLPLPVAGITPPRRFTIDER